MKRSLVIILVFAAIYVAWGYLFAMTSLMFGGAVLCAMSASALAGGLASYTTHGILIAAGGMLFFLSDIFLARRMLFPSPRIIHWVIMILYYGAQLLFGAACMLM